MVAIGAHPLCFFDSGAVLVADSGAEFQIVTVKNCRFY